MTDGFPTKIIDIGTAASDAKLEQVRAILASIGSDTTPVLVESRAKSGIGSITSLSAPSVSTSGAAATSSNPVIPNGEKLWFSLSLFVTGDRSYDPLTSGGFCWLEADLSGGTTYRPILGSKRLFSADPYVGITKNMIVAYDNVPWGANLRLGISFGTIGGTTGVVGFNVSVKN